MVVTANVEQVRDMQYFFEAQQPQIEPRSPIVEVSKSQIHTR